MRCGSYLRFHGADTHIRCICAQRRQLHHLNILKPHLADLTAGQGAFRPFGSLLVASSRREGRLYTLVRMHTVCISNKVYSPAGEVKRLLDALLSSNPGQGAA